MRTPQPARKVPPVFTRESVGALLLCALAGWGAQAIRAPLPWTLGPMIAMALARFGGAPLTTPRGGRQLGQILIATALGLYFTPEVARQLFAYGALMLLGAVFSLGLGYPMGALLARLTGVDRVTAFFSSVPGGAAEMAVLAERQGGAVEHVALAQALRILLVVLVVPSAIVWAGAHGVESFSATQRPVQAGGLALLLLLCAAGGWLPSRLGVPNAWMLGPLFVSIGLTVMEVNLSAMPRALTNTGQLLIGCALGAAFRRSFLRQAPRFVAASALAILIAVGVSAAFAGLLAWVSRIQPATLVLATAPGGIAEMCITANVLHLGVPLVTAFHVIRVIVLITATPTLYRLLNRLRGRRPSGV